MRFNNRAPLFTSAIFILFNRQTKRFRVILFLCFQILRGEFKICDVHSTQPFRLRKDQYTSTQAGTADH